MILTSELPKLNHRMCLTKKRRQRQRHRETEREKRFTKCIHLVVQIRKIRLEKLKHINQVDTAMFEIHYDNPGIS